MRLAIGDAVYDRTDMTLGTVAGVINNANGSCVVLRLSGEGLRQAMPYDLEIVARSSKATTAGRSLATGAAVITATATALFSSVAEAGANGALVPTVLVGVGSYTAVMAIYRLWLRITGPRRIRV